MSKIHRPFDRATVALPSGPKISTLVLFVGVIAIIAFTLFILAGIYAEPATPVPSRSNAAIPTSAAALPTEEPVLDVDPNVPPTPVATRMSPWESTPENTPESPHHIPAWKVDPPALGASASPSPPRPPLDPAASRPSMTNPGGVDGTRPARAI